MQRITRPRSARNPQRVTVLSIGGILAAVSYLSLTHLRHQTQMGHCSEYPPTAITAVRWRKFALRAFHSSPFLPLDTRPPAGHAEMPGPACAQHRGPSSGTRGHTPILGGHIMRSGRLWSARIPVAHIILIWRGFEQAQG
jgi:hypothetical protein